MNRPTPRTDLRRLATLGACWLVLAGSAAASRADAPPPPNAIPRPSSTTDEPVDSWPNRSRKTRGEGGASSSSDGSAGWWVGSAAVAAALLVFGGVSLASKRFSPTGGIGPIQVVGRASLSPKQAVFLVRVGARILIVGTGPQGAPAPLGEVTDPAEVARLIPGRPASRPGFEARIGGEA